MAGLWTQRSPTTEPSDRYGTLATAYDAARGKVVLFGGLNPSGHTALADTWTWDGEDWTHESPATSPPARAGHCLAYDAVREKVVLFGGVNGATIYADTWTWDGTTWTDVSPGTSPGVRSDHFMAFDANNGVTVCYGGAGAGPGPSSSYNDTWTWNGTAWTLKTPVTNPGYRQGADIAYHTDSGLVVLFGGVKPTIASQNDTWTWDGAEWAQLSPTTTPSIRSGCGLAPAFNGDLILYGGPNAGTDKMFSWDGTDWTAETPGPLRYAAYHSLAYDSMRAETVYVTSSASDDSSGPTQTWVWAELPTYTIRGSIGL